MVALEILPYIAIGLVAVFISSIAQVLLKKEAMKEHESTLKEYLNPAVIFAYALMLVTTFMLVIAFRGIPLSMGPVLESTSYIYVTFFGVLIFKERLGLKKCLALGLILLGILLYAGGL